MNRGMDYNGLSMCTCMYIYIYYIYIYILHELLITYKLGVYLQAVWIGCYGWKN